MNYIRVHAPSAKRDYGRDAHRILSTAAQCDRFMTNLVALVSAQLRNGRVCLVISGFRQEMQYARHEVQEGSAE